MAQLIIEGQELINDFSKIKQLISNFGIHLSNWPISKSAEAQQLLSKPNLDNTEKERLLTLHEHYFEKLKSKQGYQSRDITVLHPEVPDLDTLLAKFDRCHTHDDDEVRYVIDGSGFFGFVKTGGQQAMMKVEAGEYICVPAHTEHWFELGPSRRIKTIRYFTRTDGWAATYTDTQNKLCNQAFT